MSIAARKLEDRGAYPVKKEIGAPAPSRRVRFPNQPEELIMRFTSKHLVVLGTSRAGAPAEGTLPPARENAAAGLLFGVAAYAYWGLTPVYLKAVQEVPPGELLAHRIVWCALLMVLVLTLLRRWPDFFRCLSSRRLRGLLTVSSLLLATNWLLFILGVTTGRVVETSLGYFIIPLFSVLLGVLFLGERLQPWQTVAVLLSGAGIAYSVMSLGGVPWIALGLGGSFGLYGMVRKVSGVEALTALTVETLVLTLPAVGYLVWQSARGNAVFGSIGATGQILVLASGVVTAIPLLCFGAAARRLPLSTLGFLHYISPSMQLALAVGWYGEPFTVDRAISFGFIWASLALFSAESILVRRRVDDEAPLAPMAPTDCSREAVILDSINQHDRRMA
jgi:chloramphenicol-sensitive protein RarD